MTTQTTCIEIDPQVEALGQADALSTDELDQRLEQAVRDHERSERLICFYLREMRDRRGHEAFGFQSVYDYTAARFGFSERKTGYLLNLGLKLRQLPKLTAALADGRIGWTKAVRVARVANKDDEAMWIDSALSLSVRQLDRKLQEDTDGLGVKVRIWLSKDQSPVWDNAVEVCRRLAGEDLDIGRCLELIAGDFLATYAYLAYHKEDEPSPSQGLDDCEAPDDRDGHRNGAVATEEQEPDETSTECDESVEAKTQTLAEMVICPEDDSLPSPVVADYGKTWRDVLERDGYYCQFPDCSARGQLHVHHIRYRSRSGKKSLATSNAPENLVTLCVFHHRMLHAGVIGAKGIPPERIEWKLPELMEAALSRQRLPQIERGPSEDVPSFAA